MKDSAPSPRRLQYLRDYRRRKRSIRLWQVCLLAGLFALWELTTRLGLSDGFLTSSPSRMAGTLQSLWHSGDLWRHIGTSCLETVVGFTAGTLLGTAIAVASVMTMMAPIPAPIHTIKIGPSAVFGRAFSTTR